MSGVHGSKYRAEIFVPGRQDMFLRNFDPVFRSADLLVAPLTFFYRPARRPAQ